MTEDWKDKIITPRVGVAGVVIKKNILLKNKEVLMIRRTYPPHGIAFPGGFQEVGESVAQTAVREVKEETDIEVIPNGLMRINSLPHTDPRFHVTAIYILMIPTTIKVVAGDDAKEAFWMDISSREYEHEMSNTTVSILNCIRENDIRTIPLG